jgi:beta-lactamase class D
MSDRPARKKVLLAGLLVLLASAAAARARPLCLLVMDASDSALLLAEGDCRSRVTPASTFKIALAVMGFDAGLLKDAHHPEFAYREGDVDWGGENWKQPTDPARWLKYSVVWYSQRLALALGRPRLEAYLRAFDYGNDDLSGDPGLDNGLERGWIGSSLKISPQEQANFLRRLVERRLPVSPFAMEQASAIVEIRDGGAGWTLHGKTGSAFPRKEDGQQDLDHGFGWYVGWAEKEGRVLVFVRLDQDERKEAVSGGLRARDALIEQWPSLAAQASSGFSGSTASQTGRRRQEP